MQPIRLDQNALDLKRAQQSLQGSPLVGFIGVKRGLRDRLAKFTCVERDLGDKPRGYLGAIELSGRTAQGFAITDQLVKILFLMSDLGQHQLPEQPEEFLDLHPFKQVEESGIAWCLGQHQIQSCT